MSEEIPLDEGELTTDEIVNSDKFRETIAIEMTVQEIEELLAQDQKQQEAVTIDRAPPSTPVENPPQRAASPSSHASEREVGEQQQQQQQQQHAVDSPRILQAEQNRVSGGRVKLPKLTLNKFNGEMTSWAPFWDSYGIFGFIRILDFLLLISLSTCGPCWRTCHFWSYTLTAANYDAAIALLKKRFGN